MRQTLELFALSVAAINLTGAAAADKPSFAGPFYKCPDAHGADQKALFKKIDISSMPITIEGKGSFAVAGDNAQTSASRSVSADTDPIFQSIARWSTLARALQADADHRTVSVCFATEPAPKADEDGPFNFLSGRFVNERNLPDRADTIVVPPQTYMVLHYTGPVSDLGNMRFTLTDDFWPNKAPSLGLKRSEGPNVMIFDLGDYTSAGNVSVEMWTPVEPVTIKQ